MDGDSVATMRVRAVPPSELLSSLVSFDSRNGTCRSDAPPLLKLAMQRPSVCKERLMLVSSAM
jgi:hypothetical protein